MTINNLDLRIFDFVNVFLVSHFYHEPPARETGQPLPVYLTVNKLYFIYFILYMELKTCQTVGPGILFSNCQHRVPGCYCSLFYGNVRHNNTTA